MAYYSDLSKYTAQADDIYNVGWLEPPNAFNTGNFPTELLRKLISLEPKLRVNQTRGTHACTLCTPFSDGYFNVVDQKMFLGSAELWLPDQAKTKIYAAPDLILHYIYAHSYLPPAGFIEALEHFDPLSDWNSDDVAFFRL